MEIKRIILLLGTYLVLAGCLQSTAMLGPSLTFAETQSIYHSSLSFGSSKFIENKTGMNTTDYIVSKFNKDEKENKTNNKFIDLVKKNIQKTKKILNQSKSKLK